MSDPVTTAVAAALATKAVNELTDAGKRAFAALVRLVRRQLADDTRSDVLHDAEAHPASDARRRALAESLAQAMVRDPVFSEQVGNLWRQVQEGRTGSSQGSVLNVVSGDVDGNLLQGRDIYGDISFK